VRGEISNNSVSFERRELRRDFLIAVLLRFPFIPLVSFSRQLRNCGNISWASELVRVFRQLASLPLAAEEPAVLSLLFLVAQSL